MMLLLAEADKAGVAMPVSDTVNEAIKVFKIARNLPMPKRQTSFQGRSVAATRVIGEVLGRVDCHSTCRRFGFIDTSTAPSVTVNSPLTIDSPSSSGTETLSAPCCGATRYTTVLTRQSRSI